MPNTNIRVGERLQIIIHNMFYIGHIDEHGEFIKTYEAQIKKVE